MQNLRANIDISLPVSLCETSFTSDFKFYKLYHKRTRICEVLLATVQALAQCLSKLLPSLQEI
jgi:hypothetical protein